MMPAARHRAVKKRILKVEFDSSAGTTATSGTVISHDLTVGVNNATIIVNVTYDAARTVAVTCDSIPMIPLANWNASTNNYINMFYLQGVSAGTKPIAVTLNSATTRVQVNSVSYRGVAELSAFGAMTAAGTTATPAMTTLSPRNVMIGGMVSQSSVGATTPTVARRVDNAVPSGANGANGGIMDEQAISGITQLDMTSASPATMTLVYGELRTETTTRKAIDRFAPGTVLANWTNRLVGGSTANLPVNRSGRFGIGLANGTTTQYFSTHNTPADSDDFKVSGYIATAAVATFGGLMIRCASAGAGSETGVVVHFHTNTGSRGITTAVGASGGSGYTRRQDLNANVAIGDFVEVFAIGNTYTVYRTTTAGVRSLLATWVDSTNIVAPGPTRRYGGIYSGKTSATVYSPDIRDFEITNYSPPVLEPVQYTDALSSLANFTVTSSGSGITSTSDEARWNGTTDGQAIALYNSLPSTGNQYVACVVGSSLAVRASSMIFHNDATNSGYYAVEFYNTDIRLIRTSGRWAENTISVITASGVTPATGDLIEAWNIGETFYVARNGTLIITQAISGAIISNRPYQGFGMYRGTFVNSGAIADWRGGDAIAWGKS